MLALYEMPLLDLIWRAQGVHREHFDANAIQRSTLLSVKTGGCSEDCGYCSQSARYDTETGRERLLPLDEVISATQGGEGQGRLALSAWAPPGRGRRTTTSTASRYGSRGQGARHADLRDARHAQGQPGRKAPRKPGLDYYNHNLDTDREFYGQVIKTHTHDDRLDTLEQVRDAGINVCSGGIIGMGESRKNRAGLIDTTGQPAAAPGIGADQQPGADSRNAAGR